MCNVQEQEPCKPKPNINRRTLCQQFLGPVVIERQIEADRMKPSKELLYSCSFNGLESIGLCILGIWQKAQERCDITCGGAQEACFSVFPKSILISLLSFVLSFNCCYPGFSMDAQAQLQPDEIKGTILGQNAAFAEQSIESDRRRILVMDSYTPSFELMASSGFIAQKLFQIGSSSAQVCQETYGFLPCSVSVGGNLSLMLAYGFLLFKAAQFISNGSELLLEVRSIDCHNNFCFWILASEVQIELHLEFDDWRGL